MRQMWFMPLESLRSRGGETADGNTNKRSMQGPRRWASHPPTHTQVSEGPEVTGAGRASHQCAHNSNALWEGPAPERWEELQKCPRRTGAPAGKQVKAMTTPAETSERA